MPRHQNISHIIAAPVMGSTGDTEMQPVAGSGLSCMALVAMRPERRLGVWVRNPPDGMAVVMPIWPLVVANRLRGGRRPLGIGGSPFVGSHHCPESKKSARGDRRSRLSHCLICYGQVRWELHINSHLSFRRRQALVSGAHFQTHQHLEQTSAIF